MIFFAATFNAPAWLMKKHIKSKRFEILINKNVKICKDGYAII